MLNSVIGRIFKICLEQLRYVDHTFYFYNYKFL